VHLPGLERRADDAVKPSVFGVLGVVQHDLGHGLFNEQILLHALLRGGGQLRDRDEQRPRAVRAGEARERGLHHGLRAGGVQVHNVGPQGREHTHGLFHGVGDVVQLEIEEDGVAAALELADDVRSLGVEQLHADLDEGLAAGEAVEKTERFLAAGEIAGYDDVFTHGGHLL